MYVYVLYAGYKQIRALELHYPIIQFLIIENILAWTSINRKSQKILNIASQQFY